MIQEQQLFAAREVTKADARPGGYVAAGGHGGIVGNISHTGRIALTYLPVFKHTYRSDLKITALPNRVKAAKKGRRGIEIVDIAVKDGNGKLLPDAIPVVTISNDGSYSGMDSDDDTAPEIDLMASIEHKLGLGLLTGFVVQGLVPYGRTPSHTRMKLMLKAAFSGIPVALTGRGAPMGFADPTDFQIAAGNLTANKARFLLMACLLKFGSLPPAQDPDNPTRAEMDAITQSRRSLSDGVRHALSVGAKAEAIKHAGARSTPSLPGRRISAVSRQSMSVCNDGGRKSVRCCTISWTPGS